MATLTKTKRSPTNETTFLILKHLYEMGVYAWRNNTTGIFDKSTGRYRPSGAKVGVSDILFILPHRTFKERPILGQFGAIEVKTGRDKLSIEQEGFLSSVKSNGGIALTVKDYDDFQQQFQSYDSRIPRS